MSMSAEHAEQLKNEVAVVCCRTEEGTIISSDNLEDPAIFPDMEDSGLLTIPENVLKIGEVMGAKLLKTIDSLTPITPDIVEGYKSLDDGEKKEEVKEESAESCNAEECCVEDVQNIVEVENASVTSVGGTLKIRIDEGKGIDIELPFYVG